MYRYFSSDQVSLSAPQTTQIKYRYFSTTDSTDQVSHFSTTDSAGQVSLSAPQTALIKNHFQHHRQNLT